jgi:hypothetical protein
MVVGFLMIVIILLAIEGNTFLNSSGCISKAERKQAEIVGSISFNLLQSEKPFRPGILISSIARSYLPGLKDARACSDEVYPSTSNASCLSPLLSTLTISHHHLQIISDMSSIFLLAMVDVSFKRTFPFVP